jgi:solute carrier family 35, member F1/2
MALQGEDDKQRVYDNASPVEHPHLPVLESGHGASPLQRPPIDYSSLGALSSSIWRRFKSLWTKRFTFSLIAGQVVSLCITCTNVTTTELNQRNWSLPTTQTLFLLVQFLTKP